MKMARSLLLVVFVLLAGIVSCEEQADNGNGAQTGGFGGAPGFGGAAGGGAGTLPPPAGAGGADGVIPSGIYPPTCLQNLYALCPAQGHCLSEIPAGFRVRAYCYDSGVRFQLQYSSIEGTPCEEGDQTTVQAFKSDGSPCYTEVTTTGSDCQSSTITWTDAAGTVVATASTARGPPGSGPPSRDITCTSGEFASCLVGSTCIGFTCEEGDCP